MLLFLSVLLSYTVTELKAYYGPVKLPVRSHFSSVSSSKFSLLSLPSPHEEIPLINALIEVAPTLKDRYFFPGHNGGEFAPKVFKKLYGPDLLNFDLPELDGLDNIHCPEGPLLRALQLASELFQAKRSWFLVNGSTSGILSAILAAVDIHQSNLLVREDAVLPEESSSVKGPSSLEEDKSNLHQGQRQHLPKRSVMILGRDSHKASFDGLRLADCDGALLPCVYDEEFGIPLGVDFDSISKALDLYGSQVCGLLLTRPSYQGVMCSSSKLIEIIDLCHSRGVPVIVDEAHGSHLRFLERPDMSDALTCNADIVIQSSHKTLTAMSQAAMMHLGASAYSFRPSNPLPLPFPPTSNPSDSRNGRIGNSRTHSEENSATEESYIEDVCEFEFDLNDNIVSESCVMRESLLTAKIEREHARTELAGEILQDCFSMLTTTSPNAVILASLDATRSQMAMDGSSMVQIAAAAADEIRYEIRQQNLLKIELISELNSENGMEPSGTSRNLIGGVQLLDDSDSIHAVRKVRTCDGKELSPPSMEHSPGPQWLIDPLRLTVRFPGKSALDVDDKMCEERGIFCELNLAECISYGIPPGSTPRSLKVLRKSLLEEGEAEIQEGSLKDKDIEGGKSTFSDVTYLHTGASKSRRSVTVALSSEKDMRAALGRISAETICPYPPGIPVIIKGEKITQAHLSSLAALRKNSLGSGCTITGCSDQTLLTIRVVQE